MKNTLSILLWTLSCAAFGLYSSEAVGQEKIDSRVRVEVERKGASRVIVVFRRPAAGSPPTFAAAMPHLYLSTLLESADVRNVARIADFPLAVAELQSGAIAKLANDPNVLGVVKDEPVPHALADTIPLIGVGTAWSNGFGGKGQAVAVLDSGVELQHAQFAGKIAAEACFSTPASTVYQLESLCPNKLDVMTSAGAAAACNQTIRGCDHGTHVSGIAVGGGATHEGKTIKGVATEAKLVPIQVFTLFKDADVCGPAIPCIRSFPSDQIRALAHVKNLADTVPVASVNMSLGGGYYRNKCDLENAVYTDAIEALFAKGTAVVIASGNDGFFDGIGQPACFSRAISVTATKKPQGSSKEAIDISYANVSKDVDLAAPGTSVLSAVFGSHAPKTGTSMAAPHVAGAWAVLKSAKPTAGVSEILAILKATGTRYSDPRTGTEIRRIAVDRALAQLQQGGITVAQDDSSNNPQLPSIEGAKQVVVVPAPTDKINEMSAQQIETLLRSATGADTPSVRQQSLGGQNSFVIESPTGLRAQSLRDIITPNTKIFDNTPRAQPLK